MSFSITYPMGVIGMIIVMTVLRGLWRIDYRREAEDVDTEAGGPL